MGGRGAGGWVRAKRNALTEEACCSSHACAAAHRPPRHAPPCPAPPFAHTHTPAPRAAFLDPIHTRLAHPHPLGAPPLSFPRAHTRAHTHTHTRPPPTRRSPSQSLAHDRNLTRYYQRAYANGAGNGALAPGGLAPGGGASGGNNGAAKAAAAVANGNGARPSLEPSSNNGYDTDPEHEQDDV